MELVFCAYVVDLGHFQNASLFLFFCPFVLGPKFVAFSALSSVLGKPRSYLSSWFPLLRQFEMAPQARRLAAAQGNFQAVEPKKAWMHHEMNSVDNTVRHKLGGRQLAGGRPVLTAYQRDVLWEVRQHCAWLIKMEEPFNVFGCSDEEKVNYATYGSSRPAIIWWLLEKSEYLG
ncbi:uncharacterized protein LOC125312911 [Rhodamnia argentea]|uniref:Uncharacterized protein LOC125312911 n=1 Tax=Rhodamnia argentea TaxID=178133 RepID=A0ABM3GX77_9MYRT|nr:uncharacterized protein LOC125312911 [Rhodamnia argentea]